MSGPKKLQNQLKRKTKEIQRLECDRRELDMQIREGRAVISALGEAMKHFPKEDSDRDPSRSLRAGKSVARIHDILKNNEKPMHIKEILEAMGKSSDKKSQQSTGSQLNSYVREDRIFTRPHPNTFGLKEWGASTNNSPTDSVGAQTSMAIN